MQPDTRTQKPRAAVWILEDNTDYAQTVRDLVNGQPDLTCPQVFGDGETLLSFLNDHLAPDVILVDIGLPGMNGNEVVERVSSFAPATQLVMLTIHENDNHIFNALQAGATGYLLKTATGGQILESIREVLRGGAPMTPQIARRVLSIFTQRNAPRWDYRLTNRELDVLRLLVEGKSKKQIAADLSLSTHTVDSHTRNIYRKLHVHSRTQAVVRAVQENLVTPEGVN